jgi:hypothetical protein
MKAMLAMLAVAVVSTVWISPVDAADHQNLEELLPTAIEDAFPIPYRGREIQGRFAYERTRDDKDRFVLEPRIEVGLFPNFQASLRVPYRLGDAEDTDRGQVGLAGLYNFNQETLIVPALALAGEGQAPYGEGEEPWQTRVKFIATKTLPSARLQRLHLNAAWIHAYDAAPDERDDRYEVAIGYSVALQAELTLVADVVRQQELLDGKSTNLVETGLRYQLSPLMVLTAGAGVGFGRSETEFRVLFGFQYSLAKLPFFK